MKVILDLDTGIDDALALTYTIGLPDVELLGVTTTFGNVTVDTAVKNTINILDLLGKSDIPVYEGAPHAWKDDSYEPDEILHRIHGHNGIANVDLGEPKRRKEDISAVDFIIKAAEKYGKELTLITTGPMTNLADAIKKNRNAVEKIGKIVSMGGALTVPGNVGRFAEANIISDAHAAKYVLESDIPVVIVGLDVTMKTLFTAPNVENWRQIQTKAGEVITELATYYYTNESEDSEFGGAMHDPLAVEVAVNPDIVTDLFPVNLTVETDEASEGRIIANLDLLNREEKSAYVCLGVDSDAFIRKFTQIMSDVLKQQINH